MKNSCKSGVMIPYLDPFHGSRGNLRRYTRLAGRTTSAIVLSCMLLGLPSSCTKKEGLDAILRSGQITVLTRNNGHCYYTYRERKMGFEYDLAKAFSDYLGVKLKVGFLNTGPLSR
jgi:hypothetical protein